MGNQQSTKQTYQAYYNSLKKSNELDTLDPYDILGISKNHTWEELKDAYRQRARMVHPDKGGSEELFNLVTDAFKQLAYNFKMKQIDKPHYQLKEAFKQESNNNSKTMPAMASDDAFIDKFNRLFDEHKFEDDENRGYGNMMAESSKTREDLSVPQTLKKFNKEQFHKIFENQEAMGKEVIEYKEPEPLVLGKKLNFTEIGGVTEDFSTDSTKKMGLQYTDYMKAHTMNRLMDPRSVKERKQYKSIDDYEADRSSITQRPLTQEEQAYQRKLKINAEKEEQIRIQRAQQRDSQISEHYSRVSKLFLK